MVLYDNAWCCMLLHGTSQRPDANPETESTPALYNSELPCSAGPAMNCPARSTMHCRPALLFSRCTEHCYYALAVDSDERGIRANRTQE